MMSKMLTALWLLASAAPMVSSAAIADRKQTSPKFRPDHGSLTRNGKLSQLPLAYNLSDSLHSGNGQIDGSFWANAFARGSNGHDYYIASHAQSYASDIPGARPSFRGAILDITDPSFYRQFVKVTDDADLSFWTQEGKFHAASEWLVMETAGDDPLQGIRTYSLVDDVEFDFTFNFTSPALLNAALGGYFVRGDWGAEWSVPRGATEGWLMVDGERVDIVSEQSSTWLDRQFGSLQSSFFWVMANMEDSDWLDISTLCLWDWKDPVNGPKMFATYRSAATGHDSVIPVQVVASETNTWTSPNGVVWPQEWTAMVDDVEFTFTSIRPDQVFEPDPETGFPWQFSGYVSAVARKPGCRDVHGYAAVDHLPSVS